MEIGKEQRRDKEGIRRTVLMEGRESKGRGEEDRKKRERNGTTRERVNRKNHAWRKGLTKNKEKFKKKENKEKIIILRDGNVKEYEERIGEGTAE